MIPAPKPCTALVALATFVLTLPAAAFQLSEIGRYATGIYNNGGSEIVAHDPVSQRLFVVAGGAARVDVLDITNPAAPGLLFSIPTPGGVPNSVAVANGVVAIACEDAAVRQNPGFVLLTDANGMVLNQLAVGALPDMCTFTPDGTRLLVANEGEPASDYSFDPAGSVSVVDMTPGAAALTPANIVTIGFTAFNVGGPRHGELPPGVRIFGPGSTVAQDLEPEFIAVNPTSDRAFVTLQENNAVAVLDLLALDVIAIRDLGRIDHMVPGHKLDPSDRDNAILIQSWPVNGMFQPDGIAAYRAAGLDYYVTANEGDAREYTALNEQVRLGNAAYGLDPVVFPNAATLKLPANLGRLNVSNRSGNLDADAEFERIDVFGTRSFSIWSAATGARVFDSGDFFEVHTSVLYPTHFNASNDNNTRDDRSDNKGPEPEGVVVATIQGLTYAFIGLERVGGVMVFDITNPFAPLFVQYVNPRDFAFAPNLAAALDNGPEGLLLIPAAHSPNGAPILVVGNEVSGTTTLYRVDLPVSTLASHVRTEARADGVDLEWVLGVAATEVAIERAEEEGDWTRIASVLPDGEGRVRFEDRAVVTGVRYRYRLALSTAEGVRHAGETLVRVPLTALLALEGARPHPVVADLSLSFTLATDAPATLRVLDAAGRTVFVRELTGLRAGRHALRVDEGARLGAGVYLAVLEQGGERRSVRLAVVR